MWPVRAIEEFKASLGGELIQSGDKEYDEARKVYNAMIDRRPRLIVRCSDVADVIAESILAVRMNC